MTVGMVGKRETLFSYVYASLLFKVYPPQRNVIVLQRTVAIPSSLQPYSLSALNDMTLHLTGRRDEQLTVTVQHKLMRIIGHVPDSLLRFPVCIE